MCLASIQGQFVLVFQQTNIPNNMLENTTPRGLMEAKSRSEKRIYYNKITSRLSLFQLKERSLKKKGFAKAVGKCNHSPYAKMINCVKISMEEIREYATPIQTICSHCTG